MVFVSLEKAFICAVQLDPNHQEAWKDLGVLYEAKVGCKPSKIEGKISKIFKFLFGCIFAQNRLC